MAQCIKAGTTNSISVRTINCRRPDGKGYSAYSVEGINFGLSSRALEMQDWGRGNCCGPVAGIKIGAVHASCCPNSQPNHVEVRITITQSDGKVLTRENTYSWLMITGRYHSVCHTN